MKDVVESCGLSVNLVKIALEKHAPGHGVINAIIGALWIDSGKDFKATKSAIRNIRL
jgi:hypothetical protein